MRKDVVLIILKEFVVKPLRKWKFKGAFPHFHKESDGFIKLINFQFSSSGAAFCVNISYANTSGLNVPYIEGKVIPKKLRVSQTSNSLRLGERVKIPDRGDWWFYFDEDHYRNLKRESDAELYDDADKMVGDIIKLLDTQAVEWWQKMLTKPAN